MRFLWFSDTRLPSSWKRCLQVPAMDTMLGQVWVLLVTDDKEDSPLPQIRVGLRYPHGANWQ